MRPSAKRALNGQWIFSHRHYQKPSCDIEPPEILDQVDTVAATKGQSKSDHPRLMFKKHFSARWRVICFTANSKTASRFY